MKKIKNSMSLSITVFTIVILLLMSLTGLWVYGYLTNDRIYTLIAGFLKIKVPSQSQNTAQFIGGLSILFLVFTGVTLIFSRLITQVGRNTIFSDFMNTVTHELKTPIASIRLSLETLQQREMTDERKQQFYEIISADTDRLSRMINMIIETSLLDDKHRTFAAEYLTADETVSAVAAETLEGYSSGRPALTITGDAACIISFSRKGLKIIISNLISNSVKFCREQAVVRIRLTERKGWFIMYYSDNGIGIPRENRKTVFEKFKRLENAESADVRGTGLGLYYVSRIVESFKGRITIIAPEQGRGTTFRISLPIVKGAASE